MALSARRDYQITVALIGVVALLVCFVELGNTTAFRPDDESYHLRHAAEMHDRGEWWVPTWFGQPALNKPPLTYWLFFGGFAVHGVTFAAARLPMALLAIASAIIAMRTGRLLYGPTAGNVAGLLTITSLGVISMGRVGMTDMPLCFVMSFALHALAQSLLTGSPRWWALFFAAAGASTLAKGPYSLIVIGLAAGFVLLCVRPRPQPNLRHALAIAGVAVGVSLAIAWPIALWWHGLGQQWYDLFVWRENLGKFSDQYYPPWQLGGYLLQYTLPWSPLVIAAAWTQTRDGRWRELAVCLPIAWIAAVLVFHAMPATKLLHYVLPAVPPSALLVASAWARMRATTPGRLGTVGVQTLMAIMAAALLAALRLVPGTPERALVCGAVGALALAIWLLAGQRRLIGAGLAYGVAAALVLGVAPALAMPRLPPAALPHLRGHDVVLVKQQVWVFAYDIGQPARQVTKRDEYDQALAQNGRAIVSDTDLDELARAGADPRIEEVFSWPQWKRTLEPSALLAAVWQGRRDGLVERVHIVRRIP